MGPEMGPDWIKWDLILIQKIFLTKIYFAKNNRLIYRINWEGLFRIDKIIPFIIFSSAGCEFYKFN